MSSEMAMPSMPDGMNWRVFVRNLETMMRIGIHTHEQAPQRLLVSAEICGVYAAHPKGINDCYNYDGICKLVIQQWPLRQQTQLMETLVIELMQYIFESDIRVQSATVSVAKPDIFHQAEAVGVQACWSRGDYMRHNAMVG